MVFGKRTFPMDDFAPLTGFSDSATYSSSLLGSDSDGGSAGSTASGASGLTTASSLGDSSLTASPLPDDLVSARKHGIEIRFRHGAKRIKKDRDEHREGQVRGSKAFEK